MLETKVTILSNEQEWHSMSISLPNKDKKGEREGEREGVLAVQKRGQKRKNKGS